MPQPPLNPAGDASAAAVPTPPLLRQRDPPSFSGTDSADIHDWLSTYDRVSRYNKWDDPTKLNNVVFYLTDLAKTWFLNHEADFLSWETFSTRIAELFGRPAYRKADAEFKLAQRVQGHDETYTSYIEDIICLCNKVKPDMSDTEKIKHILKGVREDAFQLLVVKAPNTITDVVSFCQSLQDARNTRISSLSASPTATNAGIPQLADLDSLRSVIREIIRDELLRAGLSTPVSAPFPASVSPVPPTLQALVREEISHTLDSTSCTPSRPTYADVVRQHLVPSPIQPERMSLDVVAPVTPFCTNPRSARPATPAPRQAEHRSCFYCGIPGHIARFCRKRRRDLQASYAVPSAFPSGFSWQPTHCFQPAAPDNWSPERSLQRPYTSRNPSPPQRRSPSPYRRGRSPSRAQLRERSPLHQENM